MALISYLVTQRISLGEYWRKKTSQNKLQYDLFYTNIHRTDIIIATRFTTFIFCSSFSNICYPTSYYCVNQNTSRKLLFVHMVQGSSIVLNLSHKYVSFNVSYYNIGILLYHWNIIIPDPIRSISKTKLVKSYSSSNIRITEKTFCFKEMIKTVFFSFWCEIFLRITNNV